MIIAIAGSHGTGKSTLIDRFSSISGFRCIGSVTRENTSEKERRCDEISDETQLRILKAIQSNEDKIAEMDRNDPSKIFLMDRSYLDFVAYTEAFHYRGLVSGKILEQVKRHRRWTELYDGIIYLPIEFEIVDDGIRSLDNRLRKDVDNILVSSIFGAEHSVPVISVVGTVDKRVKDILEWIEEL